MDIYSHLELNVLGIQASDPLVVLVVDVRMDSVFTLSHIVSLVKKPRASNKGHVQRTGGI